MTEHFEKCKHCGREGPHPVTKCEKSIHDAEARCVNCGRWIRFMKKHPDDPTKYKRPKQHTDLVYKFGKGFCEMCLVAKAELEKGETLHAHHVIEYHVGGEPTRENIWIVCTRCHALINWVRRYHPHDKQPTLENQATGQTLVESISDAPF